MTSDGEPDEVDSRAHFNPNLEPEQRDILLDPLGKFEDVSSDTSGCTSTTEYDILMITTHFHSKVYPVPIHLKPFFEEEVN